MSRTLAVSCFIGDDGVDGTGHVYDNDNKLDNLRAMQILNGDGDADGDDCSICS